MCANVKFVIVYYHVVQIPIADDFIIQQNYMSYQWRNRKLLKKAHDTLVGERPYPQIILVDQSEFKSLDDALDYYFFTFKLCSVHLTWM